MATKVRRYWTTYSKFGAMYHILDAPRVEGERTKCKILITTRWWWSVGRPPRKYKRCKRCYS